MAQGMIYGVHALSEALDAGAEIQKVLLQRGLQSAQLESLVSRCNASGVPVQWVPKEKFYAFQGKNHQGVVAYLSPVAFHTLEQLVPSLFEQGVTPFLLILDKVTDVRNLGAIARTALCAGVHALVVPQSGAAPVSDDAIKTSAGALLRLPVCREKHLKTTLEYLHQSGFTTIGCTEKASEPIDKVDFSGPMAIVMGNEETGISPEVLKKCTQLGKIPMDFGVSSLNVSVAAGIILYEAMTQRRLSGDM